MTPTARCPRASTSGAGLLDASAYDYYNFVMNSDGALKTWGDAGFARKLVEFANIEVVAEPDGRCRRPEQADRGLRAAAVHLLRRRGPRRLQPGRHRPRDGGPRPRRAAVEAAVLHLVGARRPAPRGRGDDPHGAPGARSAPGPAPRVTRHARGPPPAAQLQRGGPHGQAVERHEGRATADRRPDRAVAARLRRAHRLAARRRRPCRTTRPHPARHRPAAQHDDRLPLRQRLAAGRAPHPGRQVPALRGVRARPADRPRARRRVGPDGPPPGHERGPRADAARRRGRHAGPDAGRRLARSGAARRRSRPSGRSSSRPRGRCSRTRCPTTPGTGRTAACAPTATPTSSTARPASRSSTTAGATPPSCAASAADPAYARIKARLAAKLVQLDRCRGRTCEVKP